MVDQLQKIPGPRGIQSLLFFNQVKKKGFLAVMEDLFNDYGPLASVRTPVGQTLYFVNDPNDIQTVLQTRANDFIKGRSVDPFKLLVGNGLPVADGELWRAGRRMVQPAFHRQNLAKYPTMMQAVSREHASIWLDKKQFDLTQAISQITHDIVARSLFGIQLGDELEDLQKAWTTALTFIVDRSHQILRLPLFLPTPKHREFHQAMGIVHACVDRIIERRRKHPQSGDGDMLTLLLQSEEAQNTSPNYVRDQILSFLFAGHETTANNITWTLYTLLTHPPILERVLKEISAQPSAQPTFETLAQPSYLRRVIYESLRLHPPVAMFVREAIADVDLSAHRIPKGAIVVISPYVIHHRADLWPRPMEFDPERFLQPPPKLHFLAFGLGPRTCIGEQFALMEAQIVIRSLLTTVSLTVENKTPAQPVFAGTLRPDAIAVSARPVERRRTRYSEPPSPSL